MPGRRRGRPIRWSEHERGAAVLEGALLLIAISLIAVVAMSVVGRSNRGLWHDVAVAATPGRPETTSRVLSEMVSSAGTPRLLRPQCRGSCAVLLTRGAWHDVIEGSWDVRWRRGNPAG